MHSTFFSECHFLDVDQRKFVMYKMYMLKVKSILLLQTDFRHESHTLNVFIH